MCPSSPSFSQPREISNGKITESGRDLLHIAILRPGQGNGSLTPAFFESEQADPRTSGSGPSKGGQESHTLSRTNESAYGGRIVAFEPNPGLESGPPAEGIRRFPQRLAGRKHDEIFLPKLF